MKKAILLFSVVILLVSLSLVGCGANNSNNNAGTGTNQPSGNENSNQGTNQESNKKPDQQTEDVVQVVSKENPMVVDEDNKTISVYATVNGKYLVESTIHGLNFHEGSNAPKALFVGYADTLEFHDTLASLGATPGNNLDMSAKGKAVEGKDLEVSITWDGADKEYSISEVVVDSQGKPFAFKFGGNYDAAKEYSTGCMLCMESCPIGIVSNSTYVFGEGASEFKGNQDILPADGTPVVITYKIN